MKVDAVITWVDSSDLAWRKKINEHLDKKIDWENKAASSRYNSVDEIEIAILSIIKYATFIENIYLVTDNQKPSNFISLQEFANEKGVHLEVIDHTVIFRDKEEYLPTFNSCSIITMLYRIPNLSEHFVIFNDDTFLINETKVEDYFINGLPMIRGRWDAYYEDRLLRKIHVGIKSLFGKVNKQKTGYKAAQQKSAQLLGFKKYVRRDHTPVPVRKSTLINYFDENPEFLENNIKHRFRHNSQFIISSLSNHLEILADTYVLERNYQLVYFQNYKKPLLWLKFKLNYIAARADYLFMCMQSLDQAPKDRLAYIIEWFDAKYRNK